MNPNDEVAVSAAMATMAAPYEARVRELESKLEQQRISHPTDVCSCRFDFGGGEMKMRHVCDYHKGIEAERDALALRLEACMEECRRLMPDHVAANGLRASMAEQARGLQRQAKDIAALTSRLEATEKERLDLLARVGYAEGAGEEGLRRWELAEERAKAAESRLEALLETRSSLLELVCLKRHKEAVGKDDYYIDAQPKAWARAHAALNAVAIQERGGRERRL